MKILTIIPTTDEEALTCLPDSDAETKRAAHGLYEVRRLQGDSIAQAMEAVYRCYLGKDGQ